MPENGWIVLCSSQVHNLLGTKHLGILHHLGKIVLVDKLVLPRHLRRQDTRGHYVQLLR